MNHMTTIIREAGVRSVFCTWDQDPHCDHEAAARMARTLRERDPLLRLWFYPIWSWHLDPETDSDRPIPTGRRLDVTRWLAAKHGAVAAHASQMTDLIADDPEGFRFKPETLAPFLGQFEYFIEVPR
jgi:LmbE family N-acetylglucosaminyl deacetylase